MAYATNDGVNRYKTTDGQIFTNEMDAQAHQDSLGGSGGSTTYGARQVAQEEGRRNAHYKDCFNAFKQAVDNLNAGKWDAVIKGVNDTVEKTKWQNASEQFQYIYPAYLLTAIAEANRDGDYLNAFKWTNWGKPDNVTDRSSSYQENYKTFFPLAFNAGKKAWERKNGRAMTDADLNTLRNNKLANEKDNEIPNLEKSIAEMLEIPNYCGSYSNGVGTPKYIALTEYWEKLTGRKMTKEDEIRIAGKPFLKRDLFGKWKKITVSLHG